MRKRYIQCPKTHKLIPAEEYERPSSRRSADVVGDIDPFVSSVDGSVIGSRRALREHNKRHGVVTVAEFGGHVDPEAKKRVDNFNKGIRSKKEIWKRKAEIHERIHQAERE